MLEHVIYYMPASPMEMMCQTFGPYRKPQPLHGRGRTGPVVVVVVSLFSDFFLMSYSGLNFHFNYEGHGLGAAQDSNNVPCLDRNKSGTITERSDDCSSTSSKSRDKPRDKISSSSHLSPNCNGVSPHMDGGWSNSSCTLTEENLKIPIDREAHLEGGETGLLRARTSKYLNGGSWTVEIIAFALAIASLTCIVGVLAHYKGKAMPHWPAGITLNTVIAIMTAIANAALASPLQQGLSQLKWISFKRRSRPITDMEAFDDASRGLWGSIKLLVTGRGG